MQKTKVNPALQLVGVVVLVLAAPLLLLTLAVALLYVGLSALLAVLAVTIAWCPRGIRYLIVYSESDLWRQYFQTEVVPGFGRTARTINLSRDGGGRRWWSLEWWIYRHFAGYKNRFPIVFRFAPFGPWSTIRFYEPYMESKKGRPDALQQSVARLNAWKKTET